MVVVVIIVVVLVLVLVVFAKKTSNETPSNTYELYLPTVHAAYNTLINTKYTDIQMKIDTLTQTMSQFKSKLRSILKLGFSSSVPSPMG